MAWSLPLTPCPSTFLLDFRYHFLQRCVMELVPRVDARLGVPGRNLLLAGAPSSMLVDLTAGMPRDWGGGCSEYREVVSALQFLFPLSGAGRCLASGPALALGGCQAWKAFPRVQHIPALPGAWEWAGGIWESKGGDSPWHSRLLPSCSWSPPCSPK